MIEVAFKCVAKSSKINDDDITTWTITLERGDLTLKVKTCERHKAEAFSEGKFYPVPIKEDHELGGLFTPGGEPIDRETGEVGVRRVK